MSLPVKIVPKELTSVRTVVSANVYVKHLELFKSVTIAVQYCDTLGILFDGPTLVIAGEDYLQWESDDNYIVNYAYQQIGITIAPEPVPEPVPTEAEPEPVPSESEPTPAPTEAEPTPAPTESEPTPAPTEPEPTPAPTEAEPTPAPTEAEPASEPVPTPE